MRGSEQFTVAKVIAVVGIFILSGMVDLVGTFVSDAPPSLNMGTEESKQLPAFDPFTGYASTPAPGGGGGPGPYNGQTNGNGAQYPSVGNPNLICSKGSRPVVVGAYIYDNLGYIVLNGTQLTDGEDVAMCSGQSVPLIAATYSGCACSFYDWTTYYGVNVISNPTLPSTTMLVGNVNSNVSLILLNSSSSNWGGYLLYGQQITAAYASITAPSSLTQNGSSNDERVGFWVGIGGAYGNKSLWQAGVEFDYSTQCNNFSGTATPCGNAWVESYDPAHSDWQCDPSPGAWAPCYYPNAGVGCASPPTGDTASYDSGQFCYNLMKHLTAGEKILIEVWIAPGSVIGSKVGEAGCFQMFLNGHLFWGLGAGYFGSASCFLLASTGTVNDPPNTNSAEFVEEVESDYLSPDVHDVEFVDPSVTDQQGTYATPCNSNKVPPNGNCIYSPYAYGNFTAPLIVMDGVQYSGIFANGVATAWVPGAVTTNDLAFYEQFLS